LFRTFPNETEALEFGEIDNEIIFEQRAIKIKFHVTLGRGGEREMKLLQKMTFPNITILPETSYIEPGKRRPFSGVLARSNDDDD